MSLSQESSQQEVNQSLQMSKVQIKPMNPLATALKASMKTKLGRDQKSRRENESQDAKLKFSVFLKTVLDF